ncbi:glycosyltransferase [Pectobacterium parmentieri]|uniref:glycosyltransferase n=1 Tax=Pectobacterium parmentieri TaxID=1905730 RepID=UPI00047439EE|nr:glycosyltransferase [Pectobacterium parmentieri]PWD65770.1 glycosyl transferase family 2 [Pectobacterium parmentieri]
MNTNTGAIFISFDAVAVSGITVEALKIAKLLSQKGLNAYLDLGYDIKIDKGMMNKPYSWEKEIYDNNVTLVRLDDIKSIPNYTSDFIEYSHRVLINQKSTISPTEEKRILCTIDEMSQRLAEKIIQQWENLNIGYVIVENGTLPENIIYTKALYQAIEDYGKRHQLGMFAIWRDHDLMWNSEKTTMKYGCPPYPNAVKPVKSPHITYVTLNNNLKKNLEAWCDNAIEVNVKRNTYEFNDQISYTNIREHLSIRDDDILIVRTTRIIPQKRIDRDFHLVHALNQRFAENNIDRKIYLVISGEPSENRDYYQALLNLSEKLAIKSAIKFIGLLQHRCLSSKKQAYTIEDLYYSCDLVSFLTSWDYDSYGNPIGEAISCQRCYITTDYEYYQEVYGQYGFIAPVLNISEQQDNLPDDTFIDEVYNLLINKSLMTEIANHNYDIGKKVLTNNVIDIFDLDFSGETYA